MTDSLSEDFDRKQSNTKKINVQKFSQFWGKFCSTVLVIDTYSDKYCYLLEILHQNHDNFLR